MISLPDWFKRDDYVTFWDRTWNMEHMRIGLEALVATGLPVSKEVPAGFTGVEWNALQNARREGFYEAIKLIELMRKERVKPPQNTEISEWGHITRDEDHPQPEE